jgi:smoothened protein
VTTNVYNTSSKTCSLGDRPSVVAMDFHILAFFGAGIVMSSWSWTKASLMSWERFFRK